jgi:hypothetical protein
MRGGLSSLKVSSGKITPFINSLSDNSPNTGSSGDVPDGPPVHQITAITSREPGELWIGVFFTGIKVYYPDRLRWELPDPRIDDNNALAINKEGIFAGHGGFGIDGKWIGLSFSKPGLRAPILFSPEDGLPHHKVTALAMDGNYLWLGGWGFVSVMDCQQKKFIQRALLQTDGVHDLTVSGDYVYLRHQNSITRFPRALALGNAAK